MSKENNNGIEIEAHLKIKLDNNTTELNLRFDQVVELHKKLGEITKMTSDDRHHYINTATVPNWTTTTGATGLIGASSGGILYADSSE